MPRNVNSSRYGCSPTVVSGHAAEVIEPIPASEGPLAMYHALDEHAGCLAANGFTCVRPRHGERYRQIGSDGTVVALRDDGTLVIDGPARAQVEELLLSFTHDPYAPT